MIDISYLLGGVSGGGKALKTLEKHLEGFVDINTEPGWLKAGQKVVFREKLRLINKKGCDNRSL